MVAHRGADWGGGPRGHGGDLDVLDKGGGGGDFPHCLFVHHDLSVVGGHRPVVFVVNAVSASDHRNTSNNIVGPWL